MPKDLGKKKKKEESESEEEEEKEEEENSEEGSDKGSDESGEKSDDEDEEEDEDGEEDEEEDEDKEGSDEDEDKSEKSGDSSEKSDKSGSEDEEEDESGDDSDDSPKKKKKKGKKDNGKDKGKGKKDEKKGKKGGKDGPAPDPKTPVIQKAPEPTIASIGQDLDDLTNHLKRLFPALTHGPEIKETTRQPDSLSRRNQDLRQYEERPPYVETHSPPRGHKLANSLPVYGNVHKPEPTRMMMDEKGIQCEPIETGKERRQPSPEAVRAVQEYKQRKEQGKTRESQQRESGSAALNRPEPGRTNQSKWNDEPQGGLRNTMNYSKNDYDKAFREERKGNQNYYNDPRRSNYSPHRSEQGWGGPYEHIENFHASLSKKAANDSSAVRKNLQDYYKNRPKGMFVESDTRPVDRYNEREFQARRSPSPHDRYDHSLRQGTYTGQKQSVVETNKRQINDAMNILLKRSHTESKKV